MPAPVAFAQARLQEPSDYTRAGHLSEKQTDKIIRKVRGYYLITAGRFLFICLKPDNKGFGIILSVFGGFLALPRRHKLHIFRARAFKNLFSRALNHSAAPPLPKKSCRLSGGPVMYCLRSKISRFHINCYAPGCHLSEKQTVGRGYIRAV